MKTGARKIETNGSFWFFDEVNRKYLRMPKQEGPRERPEWGDERAGLLQDLVWHDYADWKVVHGRLIISFEDHDRVVKAPNPREW